MGVLVIPITFAGGLQRSEFQDSLEACFGGRHTGSNILFGLRSKMFFDFGPQAFFISPSSAPGDQPFEEAP
jgi:hypothetical protein